MKRPRTIRKLPKRSDKYKQMTCSGRVAKALCLGYVGYLASYDVRTRGKTVRAHRVYCLEHTKRFARRFGLAWRGK